MKIERIDYAARARDRLDSVLRKIGPEPSPPDVESQRRAIAQQAFLMTRKAVEKSINQPVADNRQAIAESHRSRDREKADDRDDHDRDSGRYDRGWRSGLDIVV